MTDELTIRGMDRAEMGLLVEWAAAEGWNPGLDDANLFWANDPDAYVAAILDGEIVGGGAVTSYDGRYGFMGFFIMRPEFRGRGLGDRLWRTRRDRLLARLRPGAAIGMDGVFAMQDYYARGGFVFAHRTLRYELAQAPREACAEPRGLEIVAADALPLARIAAFDRTCFPAPREGFLKEWIAQEHGTALACMGDGELAGYGVVRRCGTGSKIGPLFAADEAAADTLFNALCAQAGPGPVYLDAPENNPAAMSLKDRYGMAEVFGCARMYLGTPPQVANERIFGVTTFELG